MKTLLKPAFLILLVVGSFLTSCKEDSVTPVEDPQSIAALAQAEPSLSILVDALTKADLVSTFSNDGNYTVFAPTNAAFVALLGATGQSELDDLPVDVLTNVLKNHVLSSKVMSTDLVDGTTAKALNGENVSIGVGNEVTISGVKVTVTDIEASNGIIHIIDAVIVPESIQPIVGTIVAPAYFNKNFTTLIAAVQAADEDILSVLLGDGPSGNGMTLFAPTNDAFEAAGITSLPDASTLSAVLKYHLLDATVNSSDIADGSSTAGAVGGNLYLSNNGTDGLFINGNTSVSIANIAGSNGVVHVIDRTLVPPSNDIVATATAAGFNKLAEALTEANLVSALQANGDFTVFAPTDAAFTALYTALGVSGPSEVDDALLEDVLLYHVVSGARVFSTDLSDNQEVTTLTDLSTGKFTVHLASGVSLIDNDPDFTDPNVTSANVLTTNGVIHVVDAVLIPADL